MNRVTLGVLLGSVSVLALPSMAAAQSGAAPSAAAASTSEVVVTGSRVIKNGNNSPTPVTVVSTDELKSLNPSTITDALNDLPVFQGSRTQTAAPNTTGTYGGGNPASNQLNLRNLGAARTLILFDGQREVPGNYIGVPDVDIIPQMLIQRVDVVTGGASAVYGSDAIAGVVNYITDKTFNGIKMEAQYGEFAYHDDAEWKGGIAGGMKLGEGGHIEASFEHYDDKGIVFKSDRDYYRLGLEGSVPGSTAVAGTAANPYAAFNNVTVPQNTFGGLISNGALKGQTFDSNGVLEPFVAGAPTGSTAAQVGGDGSYSGGELLKAPLRFDQLFFRYDQDLPYSIRFHTEVAYINKTDTTSSNAGTFNNYTFNTSNPFLPASAAAAMGSATSFTLSKRWSQIPGLPQTSQLIGYTTNAGFEGTLLGRFNWGVDVNYDRTEIPDNYTYNINNQKLAAALDVVTSPTTGQPVCYASLSNAAYANCVPLNFFGPTASSQAAMNYVTDSIHFDPWFIQSEFNAHISGDIFNVWAGPVVGSLSFEVRDQTNGGGSNTPIALANCAGLRYNCVQGTTVLQQNQFNPIPVKSQNVKEGAGEFDAPLLKDLPFVQDLSMNGALRYTDYDFGGDAWTWKIGLDWHVNNDITIRATKSRDIEAPSLYALFVPGTQSMQTVLDLLTGVTPTIENTNLGNPNLKSEVGDTTTLGFVWRPSFVPGFSLSTDAYHVKVDGALVNLQGFNLQLEQICLNSQGTSFYCTLESRPLGFTNTSAANTVTSWTSIWANASMLETYGVDIEANYTNRVLDHPYNVRIFTTFQPHFLFGQPGAPIYDFGNVAYPNVTPFQDIPAIRLTGTTNFGITDKLFIGFTERYRGQLLAGTPGVSVYVPQDKYVKALAQEDMNLLYRFMPGDELFMDVRNIFETMPPHMPGNSRNPGYPGTDDADGRYITVGIRLKH